VVDVRVAVGAARPPRLHLRGGGRGALVEALVQADRQAAGRKRVRRRLRERPARRFARGAGQEIGATRKAGRGAVERHEASRLLADARVTAAFGHERPAASVVVDRQRAYRGHGPIRCLARRRALDREGATASRGVELDRSSQGEGRRVAARRERRCHRLLVVSGRQHAGTSALPCEAAVTRHEADEPRPGASQRDRQRSVLRGAEHRQAVERAARGRGDRQAQLVPAPASVERAVQPLADRRAGHEAALGTHEHETAGDRWLRQALPALARVGRGQKLTHAHRGAGRHPAEQPAVIGVGEVHLRAGVRAASRELARLDLLLAPGAPAVGGVQHGQARRRSRRHTGEPAAVGLEEERFAHACQAPARAQVGPARAAVVREEQRPVREDETPVAVEALHLPDRSASLPDVRRAHRGRRLGNESGGCAERGQA
jgi:hypothetical protein